MTDRIYQGEDDSWYYRVRGNDKVGPFDSAIETQQALNRQLALWHGRTGPSAVWPQDWNPARFLRRSVTRQT